MDLSSLIRFFEHWGYALSYPAAMTLVLLCCVTACLRPGLRRECVCFALAALIHLGPSLMVLLPSMLHPGQPQDYASPTWRLKTQIAQISGAMGLVLFSVGFVLLAARAKQLSAEQAKSCTISRTA